MPPDVIPLLQGLPNLGIALLVIWFFMTKLDLSIKANTEALDRNTKALIVMKLSQPDMNQWARDELEQQKRDIEGVEAVRSSAKKLAHNPLGGGA